MDGTVLVFDEVTAHSMKGVVFNKNKVETKSQMNRIRVYDIVEVKPNEFLVSLMDGTKLKRLKSDGSIEDSFDFTPLLPRAIRKTKSGKLLVGVRDQGDPFTITPQSQRKLMVMKTSGEVIHEYENDELGNRLFSLVHRVTCGVNNDIYLIDRALDDNNNGAIVALSYPNRIKWKYSVDDTNREPFHPFDIVTTGNGSIVVSDVDNDCLHILNSEGLLQTIINTNKHGIQFPYSLALDSKERLWVGCTTEDESDAKLYITKLTGI